MNTHNLHQRSIEIIKRFQAPTGAYIASPNFDTYAFCWLRDGSFTAHAMDVVGEHESARRFFQWVDAVIQRYAAKVDRIEHCINEGTPLADKDYLHTRYTLQGEEELEDEYSGKFQLDGYGTWLWAAVQHARLSGDMSLWETCSRSIELNGPLYLAGLQAPQLRYLGRKPSIFTHLFLGCSVRRIECCCRGGWCPREYKQARSRYCE